jgi:hypothetical protein
MKALQTFFKCALLFSLLLAFSCKKDPPIPEPTEPVMPPLTYQGLNTFGCYIDGELFVANDGDSYWSLPAVSGSFDETENFLVMQVSREIERGEGFVKSDDIRLRVMVLHDTGDYQLFFETDHYKGYTSIGLNKCDYFHNLDDRGACQVTHLDKTKNIIAGTFYMNLVNENCEGDTLMKITDGRFDFQY